MGKLTHRTVPGCPYFVTTDSWQKRAVFQVPKISEIVVRRIFTCRDRGAYLLHEFVLMPNHLHLLLTPGIDTTLEKAVQLIKGGSSHEINENQISHLNVWQSGFHDWTIRDAADFKTKSEYIRMNPVMAKLVEIPERWTYGSACGKYQLDPMPGKFKGMTSGAKAH